MRNFILVLLLSGCSQPDVSTEVPLPGSDGGATPVAWPRRVTVAAPLGAGERLQLADGGIVPAGGDLQLWEAMVVSLGASTPESICVKGRFTALDEVPTGDEQCLNGARWTDRWTLGGSVVGINQFVGLSALVRNASHSATYRLRVVSDSLDASGTKLTLDYELLP